MTSSDEGPDRELMERYGRASRAEQLAPSPAVRAAILAEAKRVAASVSVPDAPIDLERRRTRWKMTAWGTAAAVLLAALIIAPRLYHQAPAPAAVQSVAKNPFNQAATKTLGIEPEAGPRPVVPVIPVPSRPAESMAPRLVNDAPTLRRPAAAPPPVHVPEQSVEITPLHRAQSQAIIAAQQAQLATLDQARARYAAGSGYTLRGTNASTSLLSAAAAAGDLVKTRELLDRGAAINDRDASGRTPLMLAISQNQIDAVRLLLDRGADPNVADNQGLTPFQLAQKGKADDIAALLIKAGAH